MLKRPTYLKAVSTSLANNPVCGLLGPRQCGKTTLARQVAAKRNSHYFDLETAASQARLARPELTLAPLEGLVIIDEIQRQPELFSVLRPLVDRPRSRTKFLILGSASPDVVRGASESLAGRIGFVDMGGFDMDEVKPDQWRRLWLRGGFPRSFLARSNAASMQWRLDFVRTFLERDIPQLGVRIAPEALRRFWMMIAHYHGQTWNGADLARSLGVTAPTVREYLDLLTGTFVLRQLQPWFTNVSKRQVKSPKVYVRDSGLLHALLALDTPDAHESHPKYGASWEGFAVEQVLSAVGSQQAFFWGTHAGAELDLLLFRRGARYGLEFKTNDAPQMTKSLHSALADLDLARAWIVYPGTETYAVHERVEVAPLHVVLRELAKLG